MNLRIHGLSLSLGCGFDARWFAAGGSPLCVEVDRLARSGVVRVVVVAVNRRGMLTPYRRATLTPLFKR